MGKDRQNSRPSCAVLIMSENLRFKNGSFRIMLVGDPHENDRLDTETDRNKAEDYLDLQRVACDKLKPDLVILMGDNATAKSEENLEKTLLRITSPYAERRIPFAFILGNHDLECEVSSLQTQYSIYRKIPYCLLPSEEDVSSYGDWNMLIKSSDGKKNTLNLWFTYSGNRAEVKYNSYYDFVKTEQIEDYKRKANMLKNENGNVIPAVLFQHIPVPEEYRLLKKVSPLAILTNGVRGQNGQKDSYYRKACGVKGYLGEGICPPDFNNGQFAAWKETGDIFAAFFGHDHMNDIIGTVDGITLGQCKLSGFRQYGDGMRQSVRVLDFYEDDVRNFSTEMHYYRELVGKSCRSIKGFNLLPDRISTKLDVAAKILPYAGGIAAVSVLYKLLKKANGQ